ncbi:MAG: tyrosine-type recombinase/integrase [Treponema sp.]|nr:tyrosine-type recombinase/integrase [Treponema sp.]
MDARSLGDCIDEYLLYLEHVKGRSSHTVKGYAEDFKHFDGEPGRDVDIASVDLGQLRSLVGGMSSRGYSVASINRFIAAVRGLFAYCRKNQYIQENVALELKALKKPKVLPRFMTQAEVDALCSEPDRKKLLWPARDKALFEMLYSSGCRVSEIASLRLSDFTEGYASAVVMGKGSKERYVFFEQDARDALEQYLEERKKRFPASLREGASFVAELFLNQRGTALSAAGIELIVREYSGVRGTNKPMTPHSFRHTFATAMLLNGADVREVQAMLGHSSINATQRYTHVSAERLREVYDQAFPHSGKQD